jgi:hypothetical protein
MILLFKRNVDVVQGSDLPQWQLVGGFDNNEVVENWLANNRNSRHAYAIGEFDFSIIPALGVNHEAHTVGAL